MGQLETLRQKVYLARSLENAHYAGWLLATGWTIMGEAAIASNWPHPTIRDIGLTAVFAAMSAGEAIKSTIATADRSALEQQLEAAEKSLPWLWEGKSVE